MGGEVMRPLGHAAQSRVGFRARIMSKVDTDQGLGPGSEGRRRDVAKAQAKLDASSRPSDAPSSKDAETQPGTGKVERRTDTVDDLLDGFGPSRPDLPRILPNQDTTPPPEPVRRELTPTEPGQRQRSLRTRLVASAVAFAVVIALGALLVKLGGNAGSSLAPPTHATATATATATETETETAAETATETVPTIKTTSVEALPTVATTAARPAHSHASTHAHPTSAPPATTAAPHPTGSAPPGLNLLPDDPHR
jgi:hypothetical protein